MRKYGKIDYMPRGFHIGGPGDDEHTWDGHPKQTTENKDNSDTASEKAGDKDESS